jgi:hypothetical protein
MRHLLVCSMLLCLAGGLAKADPILTLDPTNGTVSGSPGDIVGWGFDLSSDSTNWISVITSSIINESNPQFGDGYTDFIGAQGGPDNGILDPGDPDWVQSFNFLNSTGVGYYAIDPGATIGGSDTGLIDVTYELFSSDPSICPTCSLGFADVYAPFTVDIVAPTAGGVPEPSPFWLVSIGAALLGIRRGIQYGAAKFSR